LRVQLRFEDIFEMLAENPKAGHFREDLTSRPIRFFPVFSNLIVYLDKSDPVDIARVLGTTRDVPKFLK
jgi:plasmid stabilization system protein ParE